MELTEKLKKEAVRGLIKEICKEDGSIQNVHTPYSLCEDIIEKAVDYIEDLENKSILVMFNLEFIDSLIDLGIDPKNITFMSDSEQRRGLAENFYEVEAIEFKLSDLNGDNIMGKQFDHVIGNPPYHKKGNEKDTKTQAIWPSFVDLSLQYCKDDGHLCFVHPSGWRGHGMYKKIGRLMKSKQIEYLEIHDEKDGMKVFDAETRYDWYVLQNKYNEDVTEIKDQIGKISKINIRDMEIIPNFNIIDVQNLIAKDGEEKVTVLSDSTYHTQSGVKKGFMSETETKTHKYPCVYVVNSVGEMQLWYSSVKKGHFGTTKLIFSNGRISSANYFVDQNGEYGLTQFSYGIIDSIENLRDIYKAMRTKEFKNLMEACSIGMLTINKDVLKTFRKDFWKEFV